VKNKSLVVVLSLVVSVGCGGAPPETGWLEKTQGAMCDRLHECLKDSLKTIPFTFYLGTSPADCKAAFDEGIADAYVSANFGNRNFDATAADKCSQAVAKLDCDNIRQFAALHINNQGLGSTPELQATVIKDSRAKLQTSEDFTCRVDATTCKQLPVCTLSTNVGECAIYKFAPLKSPDLAAKELDAYTNGPAASTVGCGDLPVL